MSDLPALLRAYRARHGWSQDDVTAHTGVPVSTWRGWEAGKPPSQPGLLTRLVHEVLATSDGEAG